MLSVTYSELLHGGEKWSVRDERGRAVATVVRLPGTLYRTFCYSDGDVFDAPTVYLTRAELRRRFGDERVPQFPNVADYYHAA